MRAPFALAAWVFLCGGGTAHPAAAGLWSDEASFWAAASGPEQADVAQEGAGAGPARPLPGQATPAAADQTPAPGEQEAPAPPPLTPSRAADVAKFLAGGAMLLVPAVLDAVRYHRPEARWARWASRGAKVAAVLLVIRKPGTSR